MKCKICGEEIKEFDYTVVNNGFYDEYLECPWCHAYNNFKDIVHCENCNSYFSSKHLLNNCTDNNKEICPYCNKIYYNKNNKSIDF